MRAAVIYVDNLRIGGYQRLALDQAYALADKGINVTIRVLAPSDSWSLVTLEKNIIESKGIGIHASASSRLLLLWESFRLTKNLRKPLIISHSLRATFALRLVKILTQSKFVINTTIHQLPGLTDPIQRFKRFIYAQFTDRLFCFSTGIEVAWKSQFNNLILRRILSISKDINVLRNGIYLERLPNHIYQNEEKRRPRIIFLGRLAFWKGLSIFDRFQSSSLLNEYDFMFMVSGNQNDLFKQQVHGFGERGIVIQGKTISDYSPMRGDVHVYPANYGAGVSVIESISLNCLEMCCLGIPSLVTSGGMSTWPEFVGSKLFLETDWENSEEVINQILECSRSELSCEEIAEVRSLCSIENQILYLLELPA